MKKFLVFWCLLTIVFVIGLFVSLERDFFRHQEGQDYVTDKHAKNVEATKTYAELGYDSDIIEKIISSTKNGEKLLEKKDIVGVIIPHHLLAGHIIANIFDGLTSSGFNTIVVIGPNHYEKGNFEFITGQGNWITPYGIVESDIKILEKLKAQRNVGENDNVIANDHSVGNIMPFIKVYFSDAKVVPVIVSRKTGIEDVDEFSNFLSAIMSDGNVLLVASVDFAHDVSMESAEFNNSEIIEAIKKRNVEKIFSFGSEHADSPESLVTMILTMNKIGRNKIEILYDTNAGIIVDNFYDNVTSYLGVVFY